MKNQRKDYAKMGGRGKHTLREASLIAVLKWRGCGSGIVTVLSRYLRVMSVRSFYKK